LSIELSIISFVFGVDLVYI